MTRTQRSRCLTLIGEPVVDEREGVLPSRSMRSTALDRGSESLRNDDRHRDAIQADEAWGFRQSIGVFWLGKQ